jgi:hypothetical protein
MNWARVTSPIAFMTSVQRTTEEAASAIFFMRANQFCIGYNRVPGGGDVTIWLDDNKTTPFAVISTASTMTENKDWCSDIIANDTHKVELSVTGGTFELDYVQPKIYNTITPARGVVQETDAAMVYDEALDWTSASGVKSDGGFLGQGSTMRRTIVDEASVTFTINGTGLVIYTTVGPDRGDWQVYVDGILQNITLNDNIYDSISLWNSRFLPYAYALYNLPAGIHEIKLVARTFYGQVDFDAVRVFP